MGGAVFRWQVQPAEAGTSWGAESWVLAIGCGVAYRPRRWII
jgi:hypothetical protein